MSTELAGMAVLVIEDDYLIARTLTEILHGAGAEVLGPYGWVNDVARFAVSAPHIDAALVDINLHGEVSYPAVDVLLARGVHVVFMTGYASTAIKPAYAKCGICTKPFKRDDVIAALER